MTLFSVLASDLFPIAYKQQQSGFQKNTIGISFKGKQTLPRILIEVIDYNNNFAVDDGNSMILNIQNKI